MKKAALLLIALSFTIYSNAQFGKLLKDKAKNLSSGKTLNVLKGVAGDKLSEARAELDSTTFNFAISVNDNSDLIQTDSKKDKAIKLFSTLNGNEQDTEEEKARRTKDAGELAYAKGYYQQAEGLFATAKLSYELHNTNDINYYTTISNMGLLYGTMGRYTKAEEYTIDALEQRQKNLGESSLGYGASLNNLAVLQNETGNYNDAELNIKKAVPVLEAAAGAASMPVAIAKNNEAMLYQTVGRFDLADALMKEVLEISSELQGEKSNNHQKFLSNQALLYREMERYDDAISIYKELIKIKERRLGTKHPDYAHMLNNLASLYLLTGQEAEVEPLLKESMEIYENKFSTEHKLYAGAISDLGNYYRYVERFEEAKPLLEESLKTKEKVLGSNHPDYVQSQEDLALLLWKMEDYDRASELFQDALGKTLSFINSYFPPMSEAEKTKYWDQLRPRFESFYSFAFDGNNPKKELIEEAYNYHIATKGLLLSSSNKIKQKILTSDNQELIDQYLIWLDQKEALAQYYSYSKEELEDQNINRDSLEREANASEKSLSQKSDLFNEGYKLTQLQLTDVQNRLKSNEKAIEIIRYRYFGKYFGESVKYAALVLSSDAPIQVKVLDNGSQLEGRYFKYYNNVIKQKLEDDYSYDQYWAPIASALPEKGKVYISADGIYNQINLNGLSKNGQFVLDRYDLHFVGNSKYIGETSTSFSSKTAFLIGNPSFGGSSINPLPGTGVELNLINKYLTSSGFKSQKVLSKDASEVNIKKVDSPAILHIATHGYFLEDIDGSDKKVFGVSVESAKNNPLLRSGLLLADAANVDQNSASLSSSNNGVLTAYEAINLSLDGTELVVLSACETAVGDVKAGEGVYGLQRAFIGAGAKSLLMSLWKVDDEATQELMTNFYSAWLKTGDKNSAFASSQKKLKLKYPHPYYWSAFVLVDN